MMMLTSRKLWGFSEAVPNSAWTLLVGYFIQRHRLFLLPSRTETVTSLLLPSQIETGRHSTALLFELLRGSVLRKRYTAELWVWHLECDLCVEGNIWLSETG